MSNDTPDAETTDTPSPDDEVVDGDTIEAVEELSDEPEPDPNLVTVNVNGRDLPARKGDMVIATDRARGRVQPVGSAQHVTDDADHFQAVVRSSAGVFELTNALAWLP